jgi:uncharacterized protein (DUF1800 family)
MLAERRHLLRRFAFAATPAGERALEGLSADQAVTKLVTEAKSAASPVPPASVQGEWRNTALRSPAMPEATYDTLRTGQLQSARRDTELLRQWWLGEMIAGASPLRENLTLFLHGLFGCTTTAVDIPHALYGCNALLRRECLTTVPALLERLVLDPAMMMQIGTDEHRKARVSDRPAKLILDYWTVGAGQYADSDVEALSRALTGWRLAADGGDAAMPVDPSAVRAARRTGLVPTFDPQQFDARPKTILGTTRDFDTRTAIGHLAAHPATAKRFSRELIRHFGVEDQGHRLEDRLAATYASSGGSMEAMLRDLAGSEEFWSPSSRWALIKSPVHLIVGACRQLEVVTPPVAAISGWLSAAGQTLFDTPNAGEGGWPGQEAWVTPPDRLAVRYQLPIVLAGRMPDLGIRSVTATQPRTPVRVRVGPAVERESSRGVFDRLDPAPGLDGSLLTKGGRDEIIRRTMMTPQYQLA